MIDYALKPPSSSQEINIEKIKEVVNNPVKLEENLKKAFEKMDADKKGWVSHEVLKEALIAQAIEVIGNNLKE